MAENKENYKPEWTPDGAGSEFASSVMPGIEGSGVQETAPRPFSRKQMSVEEYVHGVLSGNRRILAQAITIVESNSEKHFALGQEIIRRILPYTGNSVRVGITGVPGAGKSTFIECFGNMLCDKGRKVAVLAVDPTSSISRGSILGDKTRMERLSRRNEAFIRPSPSGGTLGGVTRKSRETMLLCEAAGFDTILVETVGVGQNETSVRAMVEDDNFAQTWYVFWVLPMVFILLNLFMVPRYQITLQTGRVLQVYIVMSIALLFLLFLFNTIFLLMANSLNKNARLQQENQFLSMQQQRYESLKAAIEEARQARHDMRHQLNQISALAEAGDLDNLKAYLAKTVSRIPDLDMNFCENRAADSVVGYYCALAKREGVPFCAKLDLPQVLPVDEIDLCLVLSNLLENAFEASLRTAPARRKIEVTAYVHAERLLLVEVENAFDGEVNEKSGLFRSSKRKENGIGIQSVQHIAEKTGGASTFTHQNGVFSAKVMLCGEKQPPETADSTTELYGKCEKQCGKRRNLPYKKWKLHSPNGNLHAKSGK